MSLISPPVSACAEGWEDPGAFSPEASPGCQQQNEAEPWPQSSHCDQDAASPVAGHDQSCSCMLCALVNQSSTYQHKTQYGTHSASAHEGNCSCSICMLRSGCRPKWYTFGSFSSEAQSSGPESPHGSACACTVCSRTRAHAKPRNPSETSQNSAAVDLWNGGQAVLASGQTDVAIRLFTQAIGTFRKSSDRYIYAFTYICPQRRIQMLRCSM